MAAVIAVAILGIIFVFASMSTQGESVTGTCNPTGGCCQITNDPTTWPSGDKIWNICQAVAFAEGANVSGSVPDRLNNPGDISDNPGGCFPQQNKDGSNVTEFPDKPTGWNYLYNKFNNIAAGCSSSFNVNWTWTKIAQTYAGNWQNWVNIVTEKLGVTPDSTMEQYLNG